MSLLKYKNKFLWKKYRSLSRLGLKDSISQNIRKKPFLKKYMKKLFAGLGEKAKNTSTFTPLLETTPAVIFLNELSPVNCNFCFKYGRVFPISLLPYEILALLLT